jgi:hypothetical protein
MWGENASGSCVFHLGQRSQALACLFMFAMRTRALFRRAGGFCVSRFLALAAAFSLNARP